MLADQTYTHLPDPVNQSEFYADVTFKRFLAFVVDSIAITALTLVLVPLTGFVAIFFLGAFAFVISIVYRTVSIGTRGATPGMRLMAIEFRTYQGERPSSGVAFLHALILGVSLSMVLPQVVSVGMMLLSPRGQGLTDLLLGTVALNRRAAA